MCSRLLDAKERLRFSVYCRQQAESCKEIAKQMDKMVQPIGGVLAKREQAKAHAYTIVAMDLESIEDMTIGS